MAWLRRVSLSGCRVPACGWGGERVAEGRVRAPPRRPRGALILAFSQREKGRSSGRAAGYLPLSRTPDATAQPLRADLHSFFTSAGDAQPMLVDRRITARELLHSIQEERARLEATLARLTGEQILAPGADGPWSVKDILVHISYWERDLLRR